MPNGGSDCCGTCWFNRTNRGRRDWQQHRDESAPPYCEIRKVAIDDPFWTYCANHRHRRPDRDPIPIGPIRVYAGDGWTNERKIWILSPDSEEIRRHLVELLEGFFEHVSNDKYPIGESLIQVIIWQLGEFKERRAVNRLQWITENFPDYWADASSQALKRIREDVAGPEADLLDGG